MHSMEIHENHDFIETHDLCEKRGNQEIQDFPAKVSSGVPKKEQLFICLSAPQTEVPLPHAKSAEFMNFHENMWNS